MVEQRRSLLRYGLSKVFHFKELTNLDVGCPWHGIRATFDPGDGLVERVHLPNPISRHKILCVREWPHGHGAVLSGKGNTRALRTCLAAIRHKEHAGVDQVLIEFAHVLRKLRTRHDAGFGISGRFNDDHETHRLFPPVAWVVRTAFPDSAGDGQGTQRRLEVRPWPWPG